MRAPVEAVVAEARCSNEPPEDDGACRADSFTIKGDPASSVYSHGLGNDELRIADSARKSPSVIVLRMKLVMSFLIAMLTDKRAESITRAQCAGFPTKMFLILVSLVFVVQLMPLAGASEPLGNPYHILGVPRHATLKQIRKSYKQLVKEW